MIAGSDRFDRLASLAFWAIMLGLLWHWQGWDGAEIPAPRTGTADTFRAEVEDYAKKHGVGEVEGIPLLRPKPGDIIPMIAEPFRFWPHVELEDGQSYRLEVMSVEGIHSLAVDGTEVLLRDGEIWQIQLVAKPGLRLVCNEYCGLGHSKMRQAITVIESQRAP